MATLPSGCWELCWHRREVYGWQPFRSGARCEAHAPWGGGEVQNPTLTSGQMRPLGSPGPAGLAVPSTVSGALNSEPKPFIRRETPGTWPLAIRRPDRELHQASA